MFLRFWIQCSNSRRCSNFWLYQCSRWIVLLLL